MNQIAPLLILISYISTLTCQPNIRAVVEEIFVGSKKSYKINDTTVFILSVSGLPHDLGNIPPRVSVECLNCTKENPAIVIYKQKRGVTSFKLPFVVKHSDMGEVLYNRTERTLCPYEEITSWSKDESQQNNMCSKTSSENSTGLISLSTSSKTNISIDLEVTLVIDFLLELDTNKTITVTPSTPSFYLYKFSDNETNLVIEIQSQFNNCMVVSILNISCPLPEAGCVYHNGYFQTVTRLGAMTIRRDMYPDGFYTMLSLCADDSFCFPNVKPDNSKRIKTVVLSVHKSVSTEHYLYAMIGAVIMILVVYAIMIVITFFCCMRKDISIPILEEPVCEAEPSTSVQRSSEYENPATPNTGNIGMDDTLSIRTDSSLDETDLDVLTDAELDKNIFRTKVSLCLSDLAKKNPTVLKKKSELYFWNLTTIAIFYGLPASQLVFTYQYDLHNTGNEDICYYNFLCSHPFGSIFDFNHFFSNVGYVAFGFLFLIITHRKEQVHKMLLSRCKILDKEYGVPQHFGLFYAMGTSLIIEGVLSACYHICPNMYNFQFDASFMYVISILCMVKIYQSRHPDVNATAYSTFFLIAFVLFLAMWGVFSSISVFFWFVLTVLHVGTVFYLSLQIYYVGRIGFSIRAIIRHIKEFQFRHCLTGFCWRPMYPARFCLISIMNLCNWALTIVYFFYDVVDVYSCLLLIFIANLLLYTTFYILMKILSGEKILLQPCFYIALTVLCWSAALYYFLHGTISWKKTPAESRMYNKPCELLGFYDNHDIWHFISSVGLFFSFMVLLTLDDDLIFIHRSKISVF